MPNKQSTITVSTRGRVVIPARLRRKYGISPGSRVAIYVEAGKIIFEPLAEKRRATKKKRVDD